MSQASIDTARNTERLSASRSRIAGKKKKKSKKGAKK